MKEVIKVFDLFIENAETKEFKELIKDIKEMYVEKERLNSIIHKAILELEKYENDNETNRYAPIKETLDILRGDKE